MWVFNLSVQEKLSCPEKTLGTMESLNSPSGHLQKSSSLHLLLVSFFPFFSHSDGNPTWLCCETALSCSCLFRQSGQVAIDRPQLWVRGVVEAMLQVQLNLCVQEQF